METKTYVFLTRDVICTCHLMYDIKQLNYVVDIELYDIGVNVICVYTSNAG